MQSRKRLGLGIITVILLIFCYSTATQAGGYGSSSGSSSSHASRGKETRKTETMSEKVYKKLTEAQELIENKQIDRGLAILNEIKAMKKLSHYEKAHLWHYFGYTYFSQERYNDAIKAYENVIAQPGLAKALEIDTLYTLSQLYFIQDNYSKALKMLYRWFAVTEKPEAQAYIMLGQAHYQLKQYKKAIQNIKTALDMAKKRGKVPNENWYLLLRVNYYELGDYKNMVVVLEELLQHYPKDEYWLTLAGIYGELEKTKRQLSILEILYEYRSLKKESQLLNLANLYLLHNAPYKTAKILEKEIRNKTIKANKNNLRLLSQAWYQAKENEESIPPLKQAAALSKEGELDIRLAQSYLNLEKWEDAVTALKSGLAKGGIKRQDIANVMLGHALFEQRKYEASLNAFQNARADKRSRKTADQWIVYIKSEQNRQQQLQEALM